ncbi:histone-lysine N-methyltransferase SETMAR [Trichonephila clavipes]|nr:histone-lysine N-methyltransferase SETMAR [Trichonephila clavipes]
MEVPIEVARVWIDEWSKRPKPRVKAKTKEKRELTREHYRGMIFYDFKPGLKQEEWFQWLKLAFGNQYPCRTIAFKGFKNFAEDTILFRMKNTKEGRGRQKRTYSFFYVPIRQESKVWIFEDDFTPTMMKGQRAMKKVMHAVNFRSTGWVKDFNLEGQKTVTANWCIIKCLPEILQEVNGRGQILHHDNSSSHTTGSTVEFLKQKLKW